MDPPKSIEKPRITRNKIPKDNPARETQDPIVQIITPINLPV